MKQGKVWGETRLLWQNPLCEAHEIKAKAGHRCSTHRHEFKSNAFYVIVGTLKVVVKKKDYDLTDETLVRTGEFTIVAPGELHHFEAVTDVVALEVYFPQPLGPDIVRENCGGLINGEDRV